MNIKNVNINFFKRFSISLKFTKLLNDFYKSHNLSGIALGVSHQGKILYENYIGCSTYSPKKQLNNKCLFSWNSITSLLTSMIILKMHNKKEININSDIRQYLKDFYINKNKIYFDSKQENTEKNHPLIQLKIKNILSHQLGIDYRENLYDINSNKIKSASFDKNWKVRNPDFFKDNLPKIFEFAQIKNLPGKYTYFSISNYLLLGKLITDISKKSYMDNVYEILGVDCKRKNDSLFHSIQPNYGKNFIGEIQLDKDFNFYKPYIKIDDFYTRENFLESLSDFNSSVLLPSYGLISTMTDLLHLINKLRTNEILNDEEKLSFWQYIGSDGNMGDFSTGFMLFNFDPKNKDIMNNFNFSIGYNGNFVGNNHQILRYYPNTDIGLVIMSNDQSSNLESLIKNCEKILVNFI